MVHSLPRVLFIDHTAVLGGGELSLLDIASHFKDSCRVLLFADGPFRQRLEQAGVPVEVLPPMEKLSKVSRDGSLLQDLQALPSVLQLVRQVASQAHAFDVLYANSQKSMAVAGPAGLLARRPVIWHLRDLLSPEHFAKLKRLAAARLASLVTQRIIANSEATRQAFIESGGRADKIHVVYNGMEATRFACRAGHAAAALRHDLGLGQAPVIGSFSRLAPWKGQHVLLKALQALPGVHGLVVGDALFDGDRDYAQALRHMTTGLGLNARVHFLGFRSDTADLLQLCDVVVHTAVSAEPFGRVIVESMLAGRPVIATRAGGAVEIVEDRRTGYLVPPGDAEALTEAVHSILTHPEEAQAMAARARRAAQERFSLAAMLAGVEQQIREIAGMETQLRWASKSFTQPS